MFSLLASCLATAGWAQTPFFDSTISVGDTRRSGETYVVSTATDKQGNSYVLGSFIGTIYFGSQSLNSNMGNFLVVKYDPAGNYLWSVTTPGNIRPGDLALDAAGNLYITGAYSFRAQFGSYSLADPMDQRNGDVFVAKLDAAGHWQWAAHGGGPGQDYGTSLAVDAAGSVTVVGALGDSTATFGPFQLLDRPNSPRTDRRNTFVGRLDANGNWLQASSVGRTTGSARVALDAGGSTYLCGTFSSAALQLGSFTLANATPGNIALYVGKLTAAGSWQWAATTRGGSTSPTGIAVDGAGTAYLTGGFSGSATSFGATTLLNRGSTATQDVFVAALDASGSWRWAAQAGGTDYDYSGDLTLDLLGRPVITGVFGSRTSAFGATELANTSAATKADAFVAKLDATGAWYWALSTTGSEDEVGQAIAMAPDGAASVVGSYWGEPTFGGVALPGNILFPNVFLTKVYDAEQPAIITSLSPAVGAPGQVVTLTGSSFVAVAAVLFNGTPAASFAVQSSSRLVATVPVGVTAGPISVRTTAGTSTSTTSFQPVVLANTLPSESTGLLAWPNPVDAAAPLQIRLPKALSLTGPTQAELRNSLGQLVRQAQFTGWTTSFPVSNLPPGLYQLTLLPVGHPALAQRVEVVAR